MKRCLLPTLAVLLVMGRLDVSCAEVRLAPCFGSNMVLQRDVPARVGGRADVGAEITVEFAGQKKTAKADQDSQWLVTLDPMPANSTPQVMTVTSSIANQKSEIRNILLGDVWVCSGQSNMRMTVLKGPWCTYGGVQNGEQEAAAANYPQIRLCCGKAGEWLICSPETVKSFSAAGYFFGRELHRRLNVPIGLAEGSQGATDAESWTPPAAIPGFPETLAKAQPVLRELKPLGDADRDAFVKWAADVREAQKAGRQPPPRPVDRLTAEQKKHLEAASLVAGTGHCYETRIVRFTSMTIKGVIWYQGESNRPRADKYAELMTRLIGGWRKAWGDDFPFLSMQLVNFGAGPSQPQSGFAELRAAQQKVADTVLKAGLAVGIDIGLPGEIHPPNKQEVGRRLALVALKQVYGHDVIASGPKVKDAKFVGDKVVLSFDPGGRGQSLVLRSGAASGFELAGADGKFIPAAAELQGAQVNLTAPGVKQPCAVRYAWYDNPAATLFNSDGLPAFPFRMDEFSGLSEKNK